jgi:predicted RNA-binding protein associated with RNAse of E/G family
MITVVKQDPLGNARIRYSGEIIEHLTHGVVIEAFWTLPARDLGYTVFEPGDRFTEYYYTDRWYNIFDIARADGVRKGWYCNVAQPARISDSEIEQIDLLLDVWVDPQGRATVLDEDEFEADTMLSQEQRICAQHGLQALLQLLQTRQEMFASIGATPYT